MGSSEPEKGSVPFSSSGSTAQWFNRRYHRSGHLWQGRFFSCGLGPDHLVAFGGEKGTEPFSGTKRAKPCERATQSQHVGHRLLAGMACPDLSGNARKCPRFARGPWLGVFVLGLCARERF